MDKKNHKPHYGKEESHKENRFKKIMRHKIELEILDDYTDEEIYRYQETHNLLKSI